MNAFDRHKKYINDYVRFYGRGESKAGSQPVRTDHDVLRESFRFIRSGQDDADRSWEQRLAKRYYDKLFKEYCVADMFRYKESKIGLRWRTEKEVLAGKGQFICGAKGCEEQAGLHSFEVNFGYQEAGQRKQALVKLRVCPRHAHQLNYRKEREVQKRRKEEEREERKRRRKRRERGESSSEGSEGQGDEERGEGRQGERGREREVKRKGVEGEARERARKGEHKAQRPEAEEGRGEGEEGGNGGEEERRGRGHERDTSCASPLEGAPSDKSSSWHSRRGAGGAGDPDLSEVDANPWAPKEKGAEMSREEEFDKYFEDLFM